MNLPSFPAAQRWRAAWAALRWAWTNQPAHYEQLGRLTQSPVDAMPPLASVGSTAPDPLPSDWERFRPKGNAADDIRWFMLAVSPNPQTQWHGQLSRLAHRTALTMALWDQAPTPTLKAWARHRLMELVRIEEPPGDDLRAGLTAAMGWEPASLLPSPALPSLAGRHECWLSFWCAAIDDVESFAAVRAQWPGPSLFEGYGAGPRSGRLTWVGWLTWMGREVWLADALAQGAPVNDRVSWPPAWVGRANERLAQWHAHLSELEPRATARERTGRLPEKQGPGGEGFNVLRWAVMINAWPLTQQLIDRGVALDQYSASGETALVMALRRHDVRTARALVDAGASPLCRVPRKDEHGRRLEVWDALSFITHLDNPDHVPEWDELVDAMMRNARRFEAFRPGATMDFWSHWVFDAVRSEYGAATLREGLQAEDRWGAWRRTQVFLPGQSPPSHLAPAWTLLEGALEPGRVEHLRALAHKGVTLAECVFHDTAPLLIAMACWAPEALSVWFADTPATEVQAALALPCKDSEHVLGVFTERDPEYHWRPGDSVWHAAVRGRNPEVALAALLQCTALGGTHTALNDSGEDLWHAALTVPQGRVDAFGLVCRHFGPPPWSLPGMLPTDLLRYLGRPRSDARVGGWITQGLLPLQVTDAAGFTLLHHALVHGDEWLTECLMAHGNPIDVSNQEVQTVRQWMTQPKYQWAAQCWARQEALSVERALSAAAAPSSAPERPRL